MGVARFQPLRPELAEYENAPAAQGRLRFVRALEISPTGFMIPLGIPPFIKQGLMHPAGRQRTRRAADIRTQVSL